MRLENRMGRGFDAPVSGLGLIGLACWVAAAWTEPALAHDLVVPPQVYGAGPREPVTIFRPSTGGNLEILPIPRILPVPAPPPAIERRKPESVFDRCDKYPKLRSDPNRPIYCDPPR